MKRYARILAAGFALALSTTSTLAQIPAGKVVHVLVPFAAGGVQDILARALSNELGQALGSNVIVENRPGAGGIEGELFQAQGREPGKHADQHGEDHRRYEQNLVAQIHAGEVVPARSAFTAARQAGQKQDAGLPGAGTGKASAEGGSAHQQRASPPTMPQRKAAPQRGQQLLAAALPSARNRRSRPHMR